MTAEFDKFASEYEEMLAKSLKTSGYDSSYFDEQKIREVHRRVGNHYGKSFNFLNFGCGIGKSEPFIRKYFPESKINSADVSADSLKMASEKNKDLSPISFHHFQDVNEFNPGMKFDVIFVANVFHHIPEELHQVTMRRLSELLTPDGKLFIFEHNPLNPLTRRVFRACEFDHGCKMIFSWRLKELLIGSGFKKVDINYTLFFPKFLHRFVNFEKYLTFLPAGAQYYAVCRNV